MTASRPAPGSRLVARVWRRAGHPPPRALGVLIGLAAVAVAMVIERVIADAVGYDIGYLVLIGTIPFAVILGGLPAGITVVLVGGLTDAVLFRGPIQDLASTDPAAAWRLVLFLPIGLVLAGLVATAGAARRETELVAERSSTLLAAIPEFAVLVDPADRRIDFASDGVEALGWTATALTGRVIDDIIPDLGPLADTGTATIADARTLIAEHGATRPVEVVTAVIRMPSGGTRSLVIARDTSARIAAEVGLLHLAEEERSHARVMEAVIGAMDDGVALIAASGAVIMANDALRGLAGGTIETRGDLLRAFSGRLDDGEVPMADGERWVHTRTYPIDDRSSASAPVLLVAREVTDQRRAAAAQDAFIGVLSHELRTPVTTIVGISQLLRRPAPPGKQRDTEDLMADLADEALRLNQLIEDLLILSRAQSGRITTDLEPVLVDRAIADAVTLEAVRYPTIRFEIEAPRQLPPVDGDPTYLGQVLRNIVGNAGKYSAPGDQVVIRALEHDDTIRVEVLDEGPGFDPDDTPHLFDIFFRSARTSRQHAGSGIGLYVARTLVEAMGGTIWARLREPRGSEFGFALPTVDVHEDREPVTAGSAVVAGG